MEQQWTAERLEDIDRVASAILEWAQLHCPRSRKFAIYGRMGAGKTTLVAAISRVLGVKVDTSSPTFALVNDYPVEAGERETDRVFHLDLYRLETPEELTDMGFETYIDGPEYCFIEWPQLAEHWFDEDVLSLEIEGLEDESRLIRIQTAQFPRT